MGEVYLAHDTRLGRDVALKVIPAAVAADRQRLERFTREARALAALTHPAIGAIYDVAEHEDTRALVLELVEGDTLEQRLKRGPLSMGEALTIARTVAEALDAAHDKGLVHRDLKPGNIKLTRAGDVKILDFGLAKMLGSEEAAAAATVTSTTPGAILGTAAYMSPEQARGQDIDKRADVWAFGCLLFEMLSGRPAFGGSTWSDSMARTLTAEPDWTLLPKGTPSSVLRLTERCLQKDPRQRLRGLGGVELAFDDRTPSGPSPRRWPLAVAGIAALVLVAGAAWSLNGRSAPADVAPIRFEIPPSIRVADNGSFALSPDGRHLAFIGTGTDGRFRMWERSMDSLETKPIGGTEGELDQSSTMFWSPDSRFIGFYAKGAVRRIDRSGGQTQIVCRVPDIAVGGAWNRRDEIVVGNIAGGLVRCPASGGDPVPVSEPDKSGSARTGDFFPVFLPDGRRLIYLRISRTDPTMVGLYIADLDRPASAQSKTRLIETGFGGKFAPSDDGHGRILFVRNRGVWAVPFDTRQLITTGEPVMIVESVGTFRDGAFFDTNGSVLVHRGGSPDFQLSWRDRRGADLGSVGDPGQYTGVALGADGRRAAVRRDNKLNRADHDLWLVDLQRNITTRLTADSFAESVPAWTPDSRSLVYASGIGRGDIRQRAVDGGPAALLLGGSDLKAGDVNPLFTSMSVGANGSWLAFEVRGSTGYDIWKLRLRPPAASASPLVQDEFDQTQPSLAPNGEWLAYVSEESGATRVMVRPLGRTTDGEPLPGAAVVVSRGGGRSPRWRSDSQELYFHGSDGGIMAAPVVAGTIGEPARLFTIQGALPEWGVTSNGDRFLFAVPTDVPFTVVLNWQAGLR